MLPKAKNSYDIIAQKSGYIYEMNAKSIGISAMLLGAGRRNIDDKIDHGAGISLKKKIGDYVNKGESICTLMTNLDNYQDAIDWLESAYVISQEKPETKPFIYNIIK